MIDEEAVVSARKCDKEGIRETRERGGLGKVATGIKM